MHAAVKGSIGGRQVPRAAENFLVLAQNGYYDGTVFHRSIKNFMVQASPLPPVPRPSAASGGQ